MGHCWVEYFGVDDYWCSSVEGKEEAPIAAAREVGVAVLMSSLRFLFLRDTGQLSQSRFLRRLHVQRNQYFSFLNSFH